MYKIALNLDTSATNLDMYLDEFLDRPLSDLLKHLIVSGCEGEESLEDWLDGSSIMLQIDSLDKFKTYLAKLGIPDKMDSASDNWDYAEKLIQAMRDYCKG